LKVIILTDRHIRPTVLLGQWSGRWNEYQTIQMSDNCTVFIS